MAEFCLYCYNKYFVSGRKYLTREDVEFTDIKETCEGCGKVRYTVICEKKGGILRSLLRWIGK